MKVNSVQTSNITTNFKALRIKRGSEKYISSMPDKVLNRLDYAGEYLADTKFYHLDIGSDGFYVASTGGERLYLPINICNVGKSLIIKARQGISQITKKLNYSATNEVKQIEEKIKGCSTQIDRTAEIVKVLDDYEKRLSQGENPVINLSDSRDIKIKKLINKYSV